MTVKRALYESRASAQTMLKEGRVQEARTIYENICGSGICSADDWFMLGVVSGQLGLFDESVRCCKKAIQLNPRHAAAYYAAGMAFHAQGDLEEAARELLNAIRLNPANKEAISRYRAVKYAENQGKSLVVRMKGGVDICVPASLDCLTTYVLLEQEDWFEDEIGFIRVLLRSGDCVLDVGANYGTYTNVMASKVGDTGCVYAFEPAAKTASFLADSIQKNGFDCVALKQVALSNYSGRARLQTGAISECNSLHDCKELIDSEDVEVDTLDDVVKGLGCANVSFIKIDVEGEEENVIRGGHGFFSNYSPLIMLEIKHGDKVNLHLINLLNGIGYKPYRLVPGLGVLVPFDEGSSPDSFQLNLFFCKKDRMELLIDRGLLAVPSCQDETEAAAEECGGKFFNLLYEFQCFHGIRGMWTPKFVELIPGALEYLDGLNHYALSCSKALTRDSRYKSLVKAENIISAAHDICQTTSRTLSLVRIRSELGYRSAAATLLMPLVKKIDALDMTSIQEPFVPVSSRYENVDPGEHMLEWVKSSILECWELLRSFTSFSHQVEVLRALERIRIAGFAGPEIERRFQLKRLQNGLQEKAEFNNNILDKNGECLNPGFWVNE